MAEAEVVVLGGGIGGVVAARRLRSALPASIRVLMIERERNHLFQPSLPFVLAGSRRPAAIEKPVSAIERFGVDVMQAEVTAIDTEGMRISADNEEINYQQLVIALGAELDPAATPGFEESAINVYSLPGAIEGNASLVRFDGERLAVVVAKLPYKCPAAPYEIAFIADALLRRRGLRPRVKVDVYTPEPLPMPVAGLAVGHGVAALLAARGIGFHPMSELATIDSENRRLEFSDGSDAPYDLLLGIPPHRSADAVRSSGLAAESGYIPVDRATLETNVPGVFAIGDVAAIALAGGKYLPKAGVFAHAEAEVVASRIAATFTSREAEDLFDGSGSCFLELGHGRAGYAGGNFYGESGPEVRMRREGYHWHLGKIAIEQFWLRRWW